MKSFEFKEIPPLADSEYVSIQTGIHQYYFAERDGVVVLASLPRANGGKWIERYVNAGVSVAQLRNMSADSTIELANSLLKMPMKTQDA